MPPIYGPRSAGAAAQPAVTPDVQLISNPGYNRDRGPATVFTLRVSARY